MMRTLFKACWKYLRSLFEKPGPGHYLKERYGLDEKPDGWNDAVLGHFHRGAEGRTPGDEFRDAFNRRAGELGPAPWPPGPKRERIRVDLRDVYCGEPSNPRYLSPPRLT